MAEYINILPKNEGDYFYPTELNEIVSKANSGLTEINNLSGTTGITIYTANNICVPHYLYVENGTGSEYYVQNDIINISSLFEQIFQYWSGNTEYVNDIYSSSTFVNMPNFDIHLIAIQEPTTTTTTTTVIPITTTTTTVIPITTTTTTTLGPIIDLESVTATNALTYLYTPTYDTSNQVVHPDIYYNADGWNGYKYWMGITPYPNSNPSYENPSILVSQDGQNWSVPSGLTNPIEPKPSISNSYNSDSEIFLGYDNKMWYLFREYNSNLNTGKIYGKSSEDGINWTNKQIVLSGNNYDYISPSIIMENDTYIMYYVAWENNVGVLKRVNSSNILGPWSVPEYCTITNIPDNRLIWHINIIKYDYEYHMLLTTVTAIGGVNSLLDFAISDDGINWTAKSTHLLNKTVSEWDNIYIYRSHMLLSDYGVYDLWYSAMGTGSIWHIGFTNIYFNYMNPTTTTTTTIL